MKRFILVVFCLSLAAGFTALAFAQEKQDSPITTLELIEPTVVGTTTLKEGAYRFQRRNIDGKDYLVVVLRGKEVARVACKPEALPAKVANSDYRTVTRPDGTKALSAVRIKGETVAYVVADE